MYKSLLFLFCSISLISFTQRMDYTLSMEHPESHYFQLKILISEIQQDEILLKLPVWAPGSYLVREFSKNIDNVQAKEVNSSQVLRVEKKTKNSWLIKSKGIKQIEITYSVYAFELSVRTSFLDLTHGFVSGSGVFMYLDGHKDISGRLTIVPYKNFHKVTTALSLSSEKKESGIIEYSYKDYDQLVDCPIEIGNQEVFEFKAANVLHTVALYGEGNYSIPKLKTDMAKMVETATAVIGENPNSNYTFIIHNVVDGQGGLEHTNSATLSVNRWTYAGTSYRDFLSLVAHEYFHLWNVKRIRPIQLGPFNYDEENYTTLLWVMEGFTSYYDELLLRRAGLLTQQEYISKLQSVINYVEGSVGARVQSVAHASFDAWIKAYRPTENSSNTTMTYYSRGSMLAALIDIQIIEKYDGKKCLDHFLQVLYNKYYKELKRGFTELEFQEELEAFLGQDLDVFFAKYVYGTEIVPLKDIFAKVGVDVIDVTTLKPVFGAAVQQQDGHTIIKTVRAGSSAEQAGLSVNDEIIALNGYRVNQSEVEAFMASISIGDEVDILYSRESVISSAHVKISGVSKPQFQLNMLADSKKSVLRNYWLR